MKRIIIVAALIILALTEKVGAQKLMTPARNHFDPSIFQMHINIRDYVTTPYGKVIFELNKSSDYDKVRGMDSIIVQLLQDMAFYKDSIEANAADAYKIDYAIIENGTKQIGFRRYANENTTFFVNSNKTAKLKVDTDTVRIWLTVTEPDYTRKIRNRYERGMATAMGSTGKTITLNPTHPVIVTFCVNNYADLKAIVRDPAAWRHIVDTMQSTIPAGLLEGKSNHQRSARYNTSTGSFRQYRNVARSEYNITSHTDLFTMNVSGGISAIRNTIAPMSEIVFSLQISRDRSYNSYYSVFNLVAQPLFFFDKDAAGNHHIYDNWFINAEFGQEERDTKKDNFPNISLGVGYLAFKKGDYFKGNTFKFYLNIKNVKGILTYSPELIFTNDFKQIFPALSVKVRL